MPLITSANIACGVCAGDEATMRATVALAKQHGVAIGAHPGFADRANFGRVEHAITGAQARALIQQQLESFGKVSGFRHVKLHGGLYNMAARDRALAAHVADAIYDWEPLAMVYAPAGSALLAACRELGRFCCSEVFADRTYQRDGTLTPRSRPDALIHDQNVAVAQVLRMIRDGVVRATDGTDVPIAADTVCLHGDGPDPVGFARRLNVELRNAGIAVRASA
jgi:UPF0271 protein